MSGPPTLSMRYNSRFFSSAAIAHLGQRAAQLSLSYLSSAKVGGQPRHELCGYLLIDACLGGDWSDC